MRDYEKNFRDVGLAVRSFERSVDTAVIHGCDLVKAMTMTSAEIGIASPISQPLIASLFNSLQQAMKTREDICDAHLQLKDFRHVVRKGPSAFGDCCGTASFAEASDEPLRAVA